MSNKKKNYHLSHYLIAWSVHVFTASAAFFGILSLLKIYQHEYIAAFWFMGITVFIDAVDGTLARLVRVKTILPQFDGALLDNIVDFLNYVITPAFFLLVKPDMLPPNSEIFIILGIAITSSYQFCQEDAKTPDHFFKGFPCYWNITVFYMFIFNTSMYTNAWILIFLCVLIFIPIKYVYPSRLDYLTPSKKLKFLMHTCSLIFGITYALILLNYPETNHILLAISFGYIIMYLAVSLYRTYSPMEISKGMH